MKLFTAKLHLLRSKNPPVFRTPVTIDYTYSPRKNQSFLFREHGNFGLCNTSTVKKISRFDGFEILYTINSVYVLVSGGEREC